MRIDGALVMARSEARRMGIIHLAYRIHCEKAGLPADTVTKFATALFDGELDASKDYTWSGVAFKEIRNGKV